jgi:hypothetical protein
MISTPRKIKGTAVGYGILASAIFIRFMRLSFFQPHCSPLWRLQANGEAMLKAE